MRLRSAALLAAAALALGVGGCASDAEGLLAPEAPRLATSSALSVSISGRTIVQPYDPCTWTANVSGGTAPYSYAWTMSGGSGSNNVFPPNTWTGSTNGTGQFRLEVRVTDAAGRTGSDVLEGTSSWSTFACRSL